MFSFFKRLVWGKSEPSLSHDSSHDLASTVAPFAVPALHIVCAGAPSRSHFGGSPRLPAHVAWPQKNGIALGFLARLSLAEIHQACTIPWLPTNGALLFFYDMEYQPWGFDPEDRGGFAVLHVPDLDEPVAQPNDEPAMDSVTLHHRNIAFRKITVLPDAERSPVAELNLTDDELDEYIDLAAKPFGGKPKHQIAGFPAPIQNDNMELECQLVSNGLYCGNASGYSDPRAAVLKAGADNWRLLLQFDTDADLDVMWGDGGTIYYWVQEHEARAGNFANSWLVFQCF